VDHSGNFCGLFGPARRGVSLKKSLLAVALAALPPGRMTAASALPLQQTNRHGWLMRGGLICL
jgi:hypothetical protein